MFINYIGRLGANVATDGQQIASSLAENDSAQLQTVPILQGKPSLVDLFNLSETRLLYDRINFDFLEVKQNYRLLLMIRIRKCRFPHSTLSTQTVAVLTGCPTGSRMNE